MNRISSMISSFSRHSSTEADSTEGDTPQSPDFQYQPDLAPSQSLRLDILNGDQDERSQRSIRPSLSSTDIEKVQMFQDLCPLAPSGFCQRLVTICNILSTHNKPKSPRTSEAAKADMVAALRVLTARDSCTSTVNLIACLDVLLIYVENLIQSPDYAIFRCIRLSNRNYARLVHQWPGACAFLQSIGYQLSRDPEDAEELLVMTQEALNEEVLTIAQSLLKNTMAQQTGVKATSNDGWKPVVMSEQIENRVIMIASTTILPQFPVEEDTVDYIMEPKRFRVGVSDTIGHRPTMEDRMVIHGQFTDTADVFILFDGHGGSDVSDFAAANLHHVLAAKMNEDTDMETSFRETFLEMQRQIQQANLYGGTTVVLAYIDDTHVHVANVGDSRAVLGRRKNAEEDIWEATRLSVDHKPDLPEEEERIEKAGGYVSCVNHGVARVNGSLAVSRALGDTQLQPCVSADPYIRIKAADLSDDEMFIILACDGFFDVVEDIDAVLEAAPLVHRSADDAALYLRNMAYRRGSTDNISVMVVGLDKGVGDVYDTM